VLSPLHHPAPLFPETTQYIYQKRSLISLFVAMETYGVTTLNLLLSKAQEKHINSISYDQKLTWLLEL